MGMQTAIVKKIRQKKADYVLALKANQRNLLEDVQLYFSDSGLLQKSAYKKTIEKARGRIEKREYWQTDELSWLSLKKKRFAIGTDPKKQLEKIMEFSFFRKRMNLVVIRIHTFIVNIVPFRMAMAWGI